MLWTGVTNFFLVLPLLVHCEVTLNDIEEIIGSDPDYGVKWMFIPDGEGNPQIAYLEDPGQVVSDDRGSDDRGLYRQKANDGIIYYLYRRKFKNDPVIFRMSDRSYQRVLNSKSLYNDDLDTKMIIHGWKNTYKSLVGQKIKDAYLSQEDMNIIVVDWSEMADDSLYFKSAESTRNVGRTNARLLDYLVSHGTLLNDIHLIGHSLGAQTAGFTGAAMSSGKIGRITGLDPAMPGFTDTNKDNRLDPSDAEFVDIIHTCAGVLGSNENLGHADFWPNGGRMAQPGCTSIADLVGACSHGRAYEYFADSIEQEIPFLAYPCENYDAFRNEKCNTDAVEMGDGTPSDARGTYFLITRSKKPYAFIWF